MRSISVGREASLFNRIERAPGEDFGKVNVQGRDLVDAAAGRIAAREYALPHCRLVLPGRAVQQLDTQVGGRAADIADGDINAVGGGAGH